MRAAGDITLDQLITKSGGAASTLLLKASNTIAQTATISSSSGALNTTLWADSDNSGAGGITVTDAAINTLRRQCRARRRHRPDHGRGGGDTRLRRGAQQRRYHARRGQYLHPRPGRGGGRRNYGIYIHSGSVLQSTTGNISLTGIGGNGTSQQLRH